MRKYSVTLIILFALGIALFLAGCGQDEPLTLGATPDPIATVIGLSGRTTTPLATPADQQIVAHTTNSPASLPPCAPEIPKTTILPANFPSFPFPEGIVFSDAQMLNDNPNYLQVIGYAPLGLEQAMIHMQTALPRAGYILGTSDSEPPYEAETTFSGNGYRGGLRAATLPECEGVTQWTVVVIRK